jgi:hypothetical protein
VAQGWLTIRSCNEPCTGCCNQRKESKEWKHGKFPGGSRKVGRVLSYVLVVAGLARGRTVVVELLEGPLMFLFWSVCEREGVSVMDFSEFVVVLDSVEVDFAGRRIATW